MKYQKRYCDLQQKYKPDGFDDRAYLYGRVKSGINTLAIWEKIIKERKG